jgi:formate dehydrogenase assembly factor FdhD
LNSISFELVIKTLRIGISLLNQGHRSKILL